MRIFCTLSLAALVMGLVTRTAPAQNLVSNGDFTIPVIAPWTATGYAVNPGLESVDVDATGSSQCYGVTPGGQNSTTPYPVHKLQQSVNVVPLPMELTFDLAQTTSTSSLSLLTPTLTVMLGTQQVTVFSFSVRRLPLRAFRRERVCVVFTPQTPGPQVLSFDFAFQGLANARSSRLHLDNVRLQVAQDPQFCIRGERVLGTTVQFDASGAANGAFVVFLSGGLLAQPITIPPFSGKLALDLQSLGVFLQGGFDAQGAFGVSLPVPNVPSLAGVKLYWQGLQVATSGVGFGHESMQAFYQ